MQINIYIYFSKYIYTESEKIYVFFSGSLRISESVKIRS